MTSNKESGLVGENQPDKPIRNKSVRSLAWSEATQSLEVPVYQPGLELFRQDSPARFVYFSQGGVVKLMRSEDNGRELILGLRFAGALLGAAAVIHHQPHPFSAVTVTSCKLARLSARTFLDLVASNAQLAASLHEILSAEILDQTAQISQLACLPARHRLEQLLWQLATDESATEGKPRLKFQLPIKYWEVAQLLAITPTYVSRLLAELEREAIISRNKGWIVIENPTRLWRLAVP